MNHPLKKGAALLTAILVIVSLSFTATQAQKIKNIVLVHGAFADGSGWEDVYKILVKKGYNVSVVGNPNTGLQDDAEATRRVLDRQDGPAILVGHSYGGAIITVAGNHEKVAGLVYIAAFVPDEGESLLKLLQAGPPNPNSGILPPDANGYIWYDKAKYHSDFCGDLSKEKAAFMADSQIPVSAAVFGTEIKQAAWKAKKSWYVVATEDKTIPPDAERFMAKRAGAVVTEIKASHVVFMSQPAAVTKVIEAAVAGASK